MPEPGDGGTPDDKTQAGDPKTYTEEEVTAIRADVVKETTTAVYRDAQSRADKAISIKVAEIEQTSGTDRKRLEGELEEFRKTRFASMTTEERNAYMVEELYNRGTGTATATDSPPADGGKGKAGTDDVPPASGQGDAPAAAAVAMKVKVGETLKEMGLDPEKVDWADGETDPTKAMTRFIGSIAKLQSGQDPNETENGGDDIDLSRSAGAGVGDITKINPVDLIRRGAKKSLERARASIA